jgi:hypothetical protein
MNPASPASKAAAAHVPGSGTGAIIVVSIEKGTLVAPSVRSRSLTPPPENEMKLIEFQLIEPVKLLKAISNGICGEFVVLVGKFPL